MKFLAIAAVALAALLTIGLVNHARVAVPSQREICNPTTGQITGTSAADALLSAAIAPVVRAPQRKRSESGSIAAFLNAEVRTTVPISCALSLDRCGSKISLVRFSRLRI